MTQHIIDTDELEKLQRYAPNVGAVMIYTGQEEKHLNWIHIDELRALIANSPQADGMVVLALKNTELQKRVAALEALLSSAYNIANRNGEHTHWERFAGQLHINGISPITAKTFKILPSDTELSAYKPQADGMVLVPIEPTEEMLNKASGFCDFSVDVYKIIYKVMLSAYKPQADDVRKNSLEKASKLLEQSAQPFDEACTIIRALVDKARE